MSRLGKLNTLPIYQKAEEILKMINGSLQIIT